MCLWVHANCWVDAQLASAVVFDTATTAKRIGKGRLPKLVDPVEIVSVD
jgi:hypothetical protein